jgi:lactoylglutathione lyase
MKYGYTIVYVPSVEQTLEFYHRAFGFDIKFIHESKDYGELDTGETTLAFASHEMGVMNLGGTYIRSNVDESPFGMELAFVTKDVSAAYEKAISAGALPIKEPEETPWGQVVGYVRSADGSIIELCTPMGG